MVPCRRSGQSREPNPKNLGIYPDQRIPATLWVHGCVSVVFGALRNTCPSLSSFANMASSLASIAAVRPASSVASLRKGRMSASRPVAMRAGRLAVRSKIDYVEPEEVRDGQPLFR